MAARILLVIALVLSAGTARAEDEPPREGNRWGALTSGFVLLALAALGERRRRQQRIEPPPRAPP